jgi:hypothetical protein
MAGVSQGDLITDPSIIHRKMIKVNICQLNFELSLLRHFARRLSLACMLPRVPEGAPRPLFWRHAQN